MRKFRDYGCRKVTPEVLGNRPIFQAIMGPKRLIGWNGRVFYRRFSHLTVRLSGCQ
ncbi:hypothetical protein QUB08_23895 [Microcoleus sp. BR0-C5]|uniref:hypothetical protein n=1 Tax=Microcoleus sp. BR0-C5 TaxID=2818713 RepID=UPI002FD05D35